MTVKRRVLLVDDDQDILDQLSLTLGGEGFEVVTAQGREAGEERLLQGQPDLPWVLLLWGLLVLLVGVPLLWGRPAKSLFNFFWASSFFVCASSIACFFDFKSSSFLMPSANASFCALSFSAASASFFLISWYFAFFARASTSSLLTALPASRITCDWAEI